MRSSHPTLQRHPCAPPTALQKQKQPAFDPTKIDMKNFDPMQFMAESKRGKPLMIIVELKEKRADKRAAEELLGIWGDALRQAYVPNTGYILDTDKFLFNLDDGAYAADAKKFLLAQKETKMVQIESQQYFPGDPMPKPADTGSSKKKKKRAAPPPPPPPPPPTEAPAADAHADEL